MRAPAGTRYAKFRPRAASGSTILVVAGRDVASGAESPAVQVVHNTVVWIAVFPKDGQAKKYSVTFSIPSASMDAARTVTAATDAALAIVGELSPEDAAGALFGERSLADDRLEALDRLGNANGRYDLGDLLALDRALPHRRGEVRHATKDAAARFGRGAAGSGAGHRRRDRPEAAETAATRTKTAQAAKDGHVRRAARRSAG